MSLKLPLLKYSRSRPPFGPPNGNSLAPADLQWQHNTQPSLHVVVHAVLSGTMLKVMDGVAVLEELHLNSFAAFNGRKLPDGSTMPAKAVYRNQIVGFRYVVQQGTELDFHRFQLRFYNLDGVKQFIDAISSYVPCKAAIETTSAQSQKLPSSSQRYQHQPQHQHRYATQVPSMNRHREANSTRPVSSQNSQLQPNNYGPFPVSQIVTQPSRFDSGFHPGPPTNRQSDSSHSTTVTMPQPFSQVPPPFPHENHNLPIASTTDTESPHRPPTHSRQALFDMLERDKIQLARLRDDAPKQLDQPSADSEAPANLQPSQAVPQNMAALVSSNSSNLTEPLAPEAKTSLDLKDDVFQQLVLEILNEESFEKLLQKVQAACIPMTADLSS